MTPVRYLSGAENVYMETMEIAEAKQWCNANEKCHGARYFRCSSTAVRVTVVHQPRSLA